MIAFRCGNDIGFNERELACSGTPRTVGRAKVGAHGLQTFGAIGLHLGRHLIGATRGGRALAFGVPEDMHLGEPARTRHVLGGAVILFRLAGKAHDHVGRKREHRHGIV